MSIVQWRNLNRYRNFPFEEDASRVGTSGLDTVELPNDTLLDFHILSYEDALGPVSLLSIDVEGAGADVTFNFDYNGTAVPIVVSAAIVAPFQGEVITLDALAETSILMRPLFGEGVAAIAGDAANHGKTFLFGSLPIEPTMVALQNRHRVTAVSGTNAPADKLQGEVLIEDGWNFRSSLNLTSNTLTLAPILGAGRGTPCAPVLPISEDCEEFVFFINGLHPDNLGRMRIEGGPGIIVEPDPANNRIILKTQVDPNRPECRDPAEGN